MIKKLKAARLGAGALVGAAALAGAMPAKADVTAYESENLKLEVGITLGVGLFTASDVMLGAGVPTSSGGMEQDRTWAEMYLAPTAKLTVGLGDAGALYTGVRIVGVTQFGDGDAGGFTEGEESHLDLDNAYVGWTSGKLFGREDLLDLSVGRQNFLIGDGFLIADGNAEGGDEAAYWMGARAGWKQTAIARVNFDPVHADVFYLKSDEDSGNSKYYGVNLEYAPTEKTVIGGSWIKNRDSDFFTRDDLSTYSIRAQGNPFDAIPGLFLAGEYAWQTNDLAGGVDVDANAWYLEAAYTFTETPWSPKIGYRYAHFSGDDPNTADIEAWDPLHYGQIRGWGSWFQGEITGQYILFNSNMNSHKFELAVSPMENLTLTALYYLFYFDETPAGLDDHFGNELNLIADWVATDYLTVSGAFAWLHGGDGGEAVLGGTDDEKLFEVITTIKF